MDTASSTPSADVSSTSSSHSASADASSSVIIPAVTTGGKSAEKGSWGGLIGIIIIVGLILTAALYSWGERIDEPVPVDEGTSVDVDANI
ncbi:MAG: hypothetical protein AAB892_00540 [Patescibacteria group bacterium]